MRIISEKGYRDSLHPLLANIFNIDSSYYIDPLITPFKSSVKKKLLFFPEMYSFEEEEFDRFCSCLRKIGDNGFYISFTERELENLSRPYHYYFDLNSDGFEEYDKTTAPFESVLYSTRGEWGFFFTQWDYSLAGGSELFINELEDNWLFTQDEMLQDFFADADAEIIQSGTSWVPNFIKYVYGDKKGSEILSNSGLSFD